MCYWWLDLLGYITFFKNTLLSLFLQFGIVRRLEHSSFPFSFSHCSYVYIMDFGTLLYICHIFSNYFIVRQVLQTFRSLLVYKTVFGHIEECWSIAHLLQGIMYVRGSRQNLDSTSISHSMLKRSVRH